MECLNRQFLGRITHTHVLCVRFVQMSNIAWSVCWCVGHTDKLCKNRWTDQDTLWWKTCVGPRTCVLYGVEIPPPHMKGHCWGLLVHCKVSWLWKCGCVVVMQSIAKFLWTLVIWWLGSLVVSVLDSGAERPEFKSQPAWNCHLVVCCCAGAQALLRVRKQPQLNVFLMRTMNVIKMQPN